MRGLGILGGISATIAVFGSVVTASPANATDVALNGTFRVSSNGEWAKTNEVFMDEKMKVQTWTIASSCVSPIECTGTVTSDQGWTAPLRRNYSDWYVEHDIAQWAPCPDGTFASGLETFRLWAADPLTEEKISTNTSYFAGRDVTKTASGACGINKPLVIELPVYMERLS